MKTKLKFLQFFILFLASYLIASDSHITYVNSPANGKIAVQITTPDVIRYPEGAPIIVEIATFFTPINKFTEELDVTQLGCIHVSYLWPGKTDVTTGVKSDGFYDYGGENCIAALKDVIRFVTGDLPDIYGNKIQQLTEVTPLIENVGLYAFSHPGIAAVNVLALYGDEVQGVKYFVGRENPTNDVLSCVEIGHWGDHKEPILNPYYSYNESYTDTVLNVDYSKVGWLVNATYPDGRPYFAVDGGVDYVLGSRIPSLWNKRYYSVQMISALIQNGALNTNNWPDDLCTLEEAQRDWEFRSSIYRYPDIGAKLPDLKVMLVFAKDDHVHPALDKPHIHQAYNGFRNQDFWVRLNPDRAYEQSANTEYSFNFPDNQLNSEPANWEQIRDWAYPNKPGSSSFVSLAAVAEMADRVYYQNWSSNLDSVLQAVFPDSQPTAVVVNLNNDFTPSNFKLFQNYPNPFNPETTISYQLSVVSHVELIIFDILGKKVRTLIDNTEIVGEHSIGWDGKDELGNSVSTGVYFYQFKMGGNIIKTNKMLLVK